MINFKKKKDESLIHRVYKDRLGEYGWKCEDVEEALDAYAAKGNIVYAISVNVIEDDERLSFILKAKDESVFHCQFTAEKRKPNEDDNTFHLRAKSELIQQINESNYEELIRDEDKGNIRFILYKEIVITDR